jgi:protein-S-isoprenylcysteine O-methyltransferase Ste14
MRTDNATVRRPGVVRHARSILLLPFVNIVVIPSLILLASSGFSITIVARAIATADALIAAPFVIVGGALIAGSIRLFVRRGLGTLAPWDPPRRLVISGLYRWLRNPMKAGLFLVLAGEAIAFRSVPVAVWLAFFASVNLVYIRLWEEPDLRRRFGPEYDEYCARVPRWIPSTGATPGRSTEDPQKP